MNHWKLFKSLSLTGREDVETSFLCSAFREDRDFRLSLSFSKVKRKSTNISIIVTLFNIIFNLFNTIFSTIVTLFSTFFSSASSTLSASTSSASLRTFPTVCSLTWFVMVCHAFNCFLFVFLAIKGIFLLVDFEIWGNVWGGTSISPPKQLLLRLLPERGDPAKVQIASTSKFIDLICWLIVLFGYRVQNKTGIVLNVIVIVLLCHCNALCGSFVISCLIKGYDEYFCSRQSVLSCNRS